jgi:hypothetical protein
MSALRFAGVERKRSLRREKLKCDALVLKQTEELADAWSAR